MLSINTNLSSIIAQNSMKDSTNALNQAIERMSTGFKINHAKDNAANYSISTNMTTKINAYQIAEENAAMGLDLVTTSASGIDLIIDKLTRLRDLATQASNGTYGETSLKAINSEANALIDEIERLQQTSEYNGKSLLRSDNNFLQKVDKISTLGMQSLSEVDETAVLAQGEYAITSADDLAKLARMQNAGKITAGSKFVQAADIDLSAYATGEGWTPIGTTANPFKGEYDGNGYTISNLYINKNSSNAGLFGVGSNSILKNLGIESGSISGNSHYKGGLIAKDQGGSAKVSNCYANVDISGYGGLGGLASVVYGEIDHCYATGNLNGQTVGSQGSVAGLVASIKGKITSSYATGNVSGGHSSGGLFSNVAGATIIENCYSTGDVTGLDGAGGFFGVASSQQITIKNCYTTGNVKLLNSTVTECGAGGFFGGTYDIVGNFENCYATGDVYSEQSDCTIAGFGVTHHNFNIKNCYTTSSVTVENVTNLTHINDFVLPLSGAVLSGVVDSKAYKSGNVPFVLSFDYDNTKMDFDFQVGISSGNSSLVNVSYSCGLSNLESMRNLGLKAGGYIEIADKLISVLSNSSIKLGAVQNRLESALEEISVQYDNLVSSRSTLRDADIAEVSSHYIQAQILQQASATLMATANQSPSIALQLI